jgi:membrane protease YdiL (CAAX protease family)
VRSCPYCGKEYPDDVAQCAIDGEPLSGASALPQAVIEQEKEDVQNEKAPFLTFPDYRWSARDAWKSLGMMLVFGFIVGLALLGLNLHFSGFRRWFAGGYGYFSWRGLDYSVGLLVAVYFARTETLAMFWRGFGLKNKPTENAWFGAAMAMIIRLSGHFMRLPGALGRGVPNLEIYNFRHTLGPERYLFLATPLVLAPLFEESIYRGFLYKAFRGSYSVGISMVLIIAWTAYTHWSQYSHSLLAAFDLSLLTIVQCYLREKSASLWDCIICHAVYNWSGLFINEILR